MTQRTSPPPARRRTPSATGAAPAAAGRGPVGPPATIAVPGANPRPRSRALFVGLLVVLSLFGAQLVRLQALDAGAPSSAALTVRTVSEKEPAIRGTITDATGTVLAISRERRTVVANQEAVATYKAKVNGKLATVGVAGAAARLAPLLRMDQAELVGKLTPSGKPLQYVILAKNITPLTWHTIDQIGIPGISSQPTAIRSYPQSTVDASLVGFVNEDQIGRGGIESLLDPKLRGTQGMLYFEVGQDGVRLPNGRTVEHAAQRGRDVRLTIRNDVQWFAQNALAQAVAKYGAVSGTVVVQSVKSADLLAVASYPTFDPNAIATGDQLNNLAFSEVFEPGSTAKVMTAAAALEEGKVTPTTPMIVPYKMHRSDRYFNDSHQHEPEALTFTGALAQSSNTGIILAGEQVAPTTIEKYFRSFGIGAVSGTGFPGESRGLFEPSKNWSGSKRYTVLYGQGVSITAIQAASVYQTLANHGVRLTPRLIDAVADSHGKLVAQPRPAGTRVVSAKTADTLNQMLESVTTKDGTAQAAAVDGYRVAGKTGTALRYDSTKDGYTSYTASFIGFAPADDPQVVVSVIIQRPTKNGYYGGEVAAPVFHDVMTYALQALAIPPSTGTRPTIPLTLATFPDISDPAVLADRRSSATGTG